MSPSYRHHGSHGDLLRQDGDMGPGDEFQTPTGARWATRLELCAAGVAGRGRLVSSGKARNDGRIVKTAHRTISSSCLNRRMSESSGDEDCASFCFHGSVGGFARSEEQTSELQLRFGI